MSVMTGSRPATSIAAAASFVAKMASTRPSSIRA